jgi:hypothetical protein
VDVDEVLDGEAALHGDAQGLPAFIFKGAGIFYKRIQR